MKETITIRYNYYIVNNQYALGLLKDYRKNLLF